MGYFAVFIFTLIGSVQDVYLGHFFATNNTIKFTFCVFLVAFLILQISNSHQLSKNLKYVKENYKLFFYLNLFTAINWITFFFALTYIEPAIAGAISFSIGPIVTLIIQKFTKNDQLNVSTRNWISAMGVVLCCAYLTLCALSHTSSLKSSPASQQLIGLIFSLVSGVGMVINTKFSSLISRTTMSSYSITAFRFPILIFTTGILSYFERDMTKVFAPGFLLPVIVIGVFGIVAPMTLIQYGIKKTKPFVVATILATTPVFTFMFQLFDDRISPSNNILIGIIICFFFTLLANGS